MWVLPDTIAILVWNWVWAFCNLNIYTIGVPKGVQQDDGKILDPNAIIKDTVIDNQHLWVLLKGA